MWAKGVVFLLRLFEFEAHGTDAVGEEVRAVVEFLLECSVAAFDAAIVFGLARRQND